MSKMFAYINSIREFYKRRKEVKATLQAISLYLRERNVNILYVSLPNKKKINGLSAFELDRIQTWCFDFNKYREELPKLKQIYGDKVTKEYILSIFDGGIVVQGDKRKVLLDFHSEHQNIINGRRITIGQPENFHNCIYTHGACTWRGTGVEDQETIASFMQIKINEVYPNSYKVINSAIGRGSTIFDDFEVIKEQIYEPGDIVVIGTHGKEINSISPAYYRKLGIMYIETSSCFNRPHNYGEWFNDDTLHTNKRGNMVIANKIVEALMQFNWLKKTSHSVEKNHRSPVLNDTDVLLKGEKIYGDNPELKKYITSLMQYKDKINTHNGCIVMNCNPFTLGHRYLIEYAASQVEVLYIFVVEENKSYFSFEDRIELVRKGTEDLSNVIVLPSGNFIISATTFPGYFYKDNLKEVKIDCTNDLMVFAQYIAPALNIKIRFAGEEPLDPLTNQYNDGMREILPQYGIEFRSIPRKNDEVGVISASRVRMCYKSGQLEKVRKIVPSTTFEYLYARYKRSIND